MKKEINYKKLISELTLMDDIFMKKILQDKECTSLVLKIILEKDDLIIKSISSQSPYANLLGHSLIMDIVATDSKDCIYNIEIQRGKKGAVPKRARYHSSLIDSNSLNKSTDFNKLPETYVIFITDSDVLGYGSIIYNIDRVIRQNGKCFGDESHIIYVNTEITEDSNLGKLMQDFVETNYEKMNYKVLSDKMKTFKVKEENKMTTYWDEVKEIMKEEAREEVRKEIREEGRQEGREEGRQEGREEGRQEGREEITKNMYKEGFDISIIAKITKYSEEMVKNIVLNEKI